MNEDNRITAQSIAPNHLSTDVEHLHQIYDMISGGQSLYTESLDIELPDDKGHLTIKSEESGIIITQNDDR